MISELEEEILDQRAIIVRTGANNLQKLEAEKIKILSELKDVKEQLFLANTDISKIKLVFNSEVFVCNLYLICIQKN